MIVAWEKGLFWLWLAGTVGWLLAVTAYVYDQTNGFSQHPDSTEMLAYMILWLIPPVVSFGFYLLVLWLGRRLTREEDVRWERDADRADRRFRRRG